MKENKYKQMLGTIYTTGSLHVAEMISNSGFNWVMIDMEHSALSLEDVQEALQVFDKKIYRIVRIPGIDEILIKRILDTGCDGILVPMVKTAQEAARVIQASKYPPEGQRSVGLTRAHGYGQDSNYYLSHANENIHIMLQIEHIEGVKNIDSILKVKGFDSIFIGPYDLSASMGLIGQVTHPDVRAAIDQIKSKCNEFKVPYGIYGASPEALISEIKDGCTYLLCGLDILLFSFALKSTFEKLQELCGNY
ncbi:MAG: hypothetical protein LLG13_00780 [Bacteroidales bacterium]|nr:hypothetical protein [Bacteroidales bacterium]